MALPGVSFSPLNTSSPQGTSGQASPLQDAIKILSFRMPKVVGAATGSPLAGKLGDSVADNWLMNLFQGLLPEGNSPVSSAPGAPGAPGAPAAQPPFGFPSAPPSGPGAPGAPPPVVSGAPPPGAPPPSAPPPVVVFSLPGIPPVLGPPETPVPEPNLPEPPVIPPVEFPDINSWGIGSNRGFPGSGLRWR